MLFRDPRRPRPLTVPAPSFSRPPACPPDPLAPPPPLPGPSRAINPLTRHPRAPEASPDTPPATPTPPHAQCAGGELAALRRHAAPGRGQADAPEGGAAGETRPRQTRPRQSRVKMLNSATAVSLREARGAKRVPFPARPGHLLLRAVRGAKGCICLIVCGTHKQ